MLKLKSCVYWEWNQVGSGYVQAASNKLTACSASSSSFATARTAYSLLTSHPDVIQVQTRGMPSHGSRFYSVVCCDLFISLPHSSAEQSVIVTAYNNIFQFKDADGTRKIQAESYNAAGQRPKAINSILRVLGHESYQDPPIPRLEV